VSTLFFSYSHADESLRDELEKHLSGLRRHGVISSWHDRLITAGSDLDSAIDSFLNTSDVILLLVSPDFISSDYCYQREMTLALERHRRGEARVIPVILRPCDWQGLPFGKLLATPTDGRAITTWSNRDQAFLDVVLAIKRALKDPNTVSKGNATSSGRARATAMGGPPRGTARPSKAEGSARALTTGYGGDRTPRTPLDKARLVRAAEQFAYEKSKMRSSEGLKAIFNKVAELFQQIKIHCDQITAQGDMEIRCSYHLKPGEVYQACGVTDDRVSLTVTWRQIYRNSLDNCSLIVAEFSGGLPAAGLRVHIDPPVKLTEIQYFPELSPVFEYGWRQAEEIEFLSSAVLAGECVSRFIDLVSSFTRGEIEKAFP
jgi:hypothetical protein